MNCEFLPDPERARVLRHLFKEQLKESYLDMMKAVHVAKPELFTQALVERFDALAVDQLNGFHSLVYHYSIEALGNSQFDEVKRVLETMIDDDYAGLIGYVPAARVDRALKLDIFKKAVAGTSYTQMELDDTSPAVERTAGQVLDDGASRLEAVYPELINEVRTLVESVMFFESAGATAERALSFTSNRKQSLILLNGSYDQRWIFLLDKYVHEAAHTYLFSINLQEELVSNSGEAVFSSPLRHDKRSLIAIYHATFVIERLILCFSRMLALSALSDDDREQIQTLVTFYQSRIDNGYSVLMEHAKMTPLGLRLIQDGRDYARSVECDAD